MAYEFVLRHVNKSVVVEGVYTKRKWEYPVKAIREAIRNAVVHRDYSLAGKDIKIAIYDDMIEITNPGKLLPSIDYSKLYDRQSDVRNKVLAPVFKLLGIIDQWGNGLKLIGDELDKFDNIELVWKESGLQFQVQFVDTRYIKESGIVEKKGSEKSSEKGSEKSSEKKHGKTRDKVVEIIKEESKISANEISIKLGVSQRAIEKHITNLKKEGILKRIGPDKGGHWEIVINK